MRDLPLQLQQAAYLRLLGMVREGDAFRHIEVFCLSMQPYPESESDPPDSLLESMSIPGAAFVRESRCVLDGVVRDAVTGQYALLLGLDSARVVSEKQAIVFVEWYRAPLEAEGYRCEAVREDDDWEVQHCTLVSYS